MNNSAPKVFISHSSADKDRFVLRFAVRLRDVGIDAWVDQWEMNPGDSLVGKLFDEGLKECGGVVVILSKNSVASPWVREEINTAFVKKILNSTKLIPVRLDDCQVPECLTSTVYETIADTENYDEAFGRIVNSIYGQYEKPPLGQAPAYVTDETPAMQGLARIDAIVLEAACKISIERNTKLIQTEELVERLSMQGISESQIIESQEILGGRDFVKVLRYMGPPRVFAMSLQLAGFDAFAQAGIAGYQDLCRSVAHRLIRGEAMDNFSLAEAVTQPIRIVEHILESMEHNRLIKCSKSMGGPRSTYVIHVSAELRRLYSE